MPDNIDELDPETITLRMMRISAVCSCGESWRLSADATLETRKAIGDIAPKLADAFRTAVPCSADLTAAMFGAADVQQRAFTHVIRHGSDHIVTVRTS